MISDLHSLHGNVLDLVQYVLKLASDVPSADRRRRLVKSGA